MPVTRFSQYILRDTSQNMVSLIKGFEDLSKAGTIRRQIILIETWLSALISCKHPKTKKHERTYYAKIYLR